MFITFFLIVLLTRVSSLDWDYIWEAESKMAVGKILFRDIFLTPFGFALDTEPDLCRRNNAHDVSFWKYWGDALLKRVSSLDWDCVWEAESKIAVGKILFRDIFLTPFGFDLDTEPDLCMRKKPHDISFWKYWGDALLESLQRFDCLLNVESSRRIGQDLFRGIFLTPFGLEWDPRKGNRPSDGISFWHHNDDPVFIFFHFLFAIGPTILVFTCVMLLTFLVAKEIPKKEIVPKRKSCRRLKTRKRWFSKKTVAKKGKNIFQ